MSEKYTYSISNDFLNSIVDTTALVSQIGNSSITRKLEYINTDQDECDIWFLDVLTESDLVTLSGVVSSHTGEPLPTEIQEVTFGNAVRGKLLVQETSRVLNTTTYFTGAGDDPNNPTNVGGGNRLFLEHTISGSADMSVTIDLNIMGNETYVHEGYLTWSNCHNDTVDFEILPTTVTYTASSGTYYNIYGGYMVVPAAGNGTIQVTSDLTLCHGGLVQMPLSEEGTRSTAFWNADWNTSTKRFENITAAPLGNGEFNMFTVPVVLSRFANKITLLDNGFIMLQTADSDAIGHGMRIRLTGHTYTNGTVGDHQWAVAGMLTLHREKTV